MTTECDENDASPEFAQFQCKRSSMKVNAPKDRVNYGYAVQNGRLKNTQANNLTATCSGQKKKWLVLYKAVLHQNLQSGLMAAHIRTDFFSFSEIDLWSLSEYILYFSS